MKRIQQFLLHCFALLLLSCAGKPVQERKITVTIEPQRYFAEAIVDTLFTVETLIPSGVSPETYDPSPVQMLRLARSRAFFYVGGLGFETAWIDKLKANNPAVRFYRTDLNINPTTYEAGSSKTEENHNHNFGNDPHVWVSPLNAITIVENMYSALAETDPENRETYLTNTQKIYRKIIETDTRIKEILKNSTQKSFIIFHPSLTYFARDYGLTQYAIESDGKEPSPEQLQQLILTARREGIRTVFIQQEFDSRNAEIIAKETGCRLVKINPLSYQWHDELLNIAKALQ
jgi:zinc transport system substrate-binding protein